MKYLNRLIAVGGGRSYAALRPVRGHDWWETPLASLDHSIQVLNVDSRVVVLGPGENRAAYYEVQFE